MTGQLVTAHTALYALRQAAREASQTIQELDAAATDLAIVTGSNSQEAYALLSQYNALAKQLGTTTTQVANAADEWLRQGRTVSETTDLIEQSMILSKVGAMGSAEATKNLTSALMGYKLEAKDAAGIVDRLTGIDLKAAVTANDLAVAMSRTAAGANIAGVSMDRLLGIIAAIEETTQKSAETVGESVKTMLARLNNIKIGKFIDDESGESLNDTEKVLKEFGIALRDANGEFRDATDVLDELYGKWNSFTSLEKSAIAVAAAGTRQRENFLVLMENYGKALEYAGVAADSSGTALKKFAAYEDSIEAKANAFTAAMESLTLDTLDSGLVKELIDTGTAIMELAEQTGLLKAALLGLGVGGVLKGVGAISSGFASAKQNILALGEAVQTLRNVQNVGMISGETINRLGTLTKGLTDEQLKLVLSTKELSTAQMSQILMAGGLSKAEAAVKLQTLGLATAEGTATAATFTLSGAVTGLGTAIKAAFAANPVGMIMLAVGAAYELVKGIMAIYDAVTITAEEATEAMEQSFSEFEEAENKVNSLNDELKTTQDRIDELNAKEALTFVEESELQKLRESVELLQIQADLAEKERVREAKEAADDTITAYRKNFKHDISANTVQEYMDYSNTSGNNAALFADESNISAMLAGLQQMKRLRDELDKSSENYQEDYQHFQGVIDDATGSLENQIKVLSTYKANLEAIPYNELTDNQKAALDEINAAIKLMYTTLDPAKWTEIQWGSIVSDEKYSADVKKLNELAAQSEITADTIKSQFPALAQACADAGIAVEDVVGNINASFRSADGDGVSNYTAKLENLSDVISGLKSSYDLLETAQEDMSNGGGLSPETIEKLAKAEENYLDYLYEENGVVKLNTEAWKENANAKMLGEMDQIQNEIDSLEAQNDALREHIAYYEEQRKLGSDGGIWSSMIAETTADIEENSRAIEENQTKLAIYSGLYSSITGDIETYASALSNFSNIANSIDTISGSFQTLADLQAEVANGFTMSLDKALEFAKAYPEIMNNAQVAADGQISLNEDVVNSFIEGKKAELDAQIDAKVAELESDKEVLQAKMEAAQAQLDLAKNVGEGEGQVAKEVAEYRIRASNEMVQALIDNGIDEAEAFKLAAQAMSLNAEEFDRVAKEVCTDVDGNFNNAAYNAAMGIYENMERAKTDIDSVTKQAHEAANAIAGIASGTVLGTEGKKKGSGGGRKRKAIETEVTSGEFNGFDFDFDFKKASLDDFISQVELDISSYQNAISQIDGQIAALQALKNTPLKSFQSSGSGDKGGSGKGGGSSSSVKDIEEYIASIDEYREAVERLRKAQAEVERITTDIDNAGSIEKKIALEKELIGAYQKEQAALHNLNNLRDGTITAGVKTLQDLGFAVKYNADTNELWVENLEHLNALTADSKGGYDTLQEATNALRKNTEDLINTLTDLNDENREGSETWRELASSIHEANIAIYESRVKASENQIALNENWLDNAIDANDTDGIEKYTANIIGQYRQMQETVHEEAEYYRSLGYADTSNEVSKLSDLWWEYEQNIKDATISAYEAIRNASENQLGLTQTHLEQAMNRGDLDSVSRHTDEVVGLYRQMQENIHRQADYYRSKGYAETSDEIRQLSDLWWDYEQNIRDAINSAYDAITGSLGNKITLTENWLDNAINKKNSDNVKRYTTEMISNYKALQDVYHKEADLLRDAGYSDTSDEVSKLSDAWWDLEENIKSAKENLVNYFIDIVDAAHDAVDGIQNVASTLSDAAQEFADNDGWISVDTYQSITKLGTEYMQMLINENNELVINRDRINAIIEAKTRQLAVEQALSYVERLRLAATGASNENLDQLCFATTQATNSTWGLVYAELALMQQTGLLNGAQYQAALHNIQAIQSLAETAVAGIGQTAGAAAEEMNNLKKQLEDQKDALEDLLDELEDMKDGCDDLVKYVMDMLKDRIKQQIDALNDAKKAVKDYVDQLKEAMRAEKENAEYEDELANKLKAIAKLQSKIDALSLDDSRKAQAEKMALEEELAELQKELSKFQADHALDVTEETLDKQYEAYEQEKDDEIEKLEESISSTQKLYDMAIKYIKENWSTLYRELLDWNYEYGNNLNSEITVAWEAAQEAASRYGDFVTAIMGGIESDIANITAQIQSLTAQISNLSTSTSGVNGIGGAVPNVVGKVDADSSYSDDDMKQAKRKAVSDVVSQMRALSAQWHTADKATQKQLSDQALQLGATLASYGVVAHRDEPTGAWYIDNDLLNPSNVGKLLYNCYHTGGFVGEEPLKPNEEYIKAEKGELILTNSQQDSFAAQVDSFKATADAFSKSVMDMPITVGSLWSGGFAEGSNPTGSVSTDNSRTININEGDIHVSVPSGDGKIIADEVRAITRDNLNQISRYLRRP